MWAALPLRLCRREPQQRLTGLLVHAAALTSGLRVAFGRATLYHTKLG
jgi:hypothetical protein